ncbi:FtsW/RodA/SpoVE family cell cycle protein [Knoellia subterranea]|uniref:FtsW/RodA/SpoVE family cell cycle protein n=1 Tax=Knoellia subterranea TaxID=184882 RepID=UPI000B30E805|nr:FtsW/RodA/SpoVE family cell cycle protein [Knoellia subterranea]
MRLGGPSFRGSWLRQDLGLLIGAAGTSVVGALLVWSATHESAGTAYLVRHLLNTAIGIVLAIGVTRLGHHGLRLVAPWIYGVSILGLLAVLTPLGLTVNGSRSWIPVAAGFTVQPSEFAKVGLALVLGLVFADRWERRVAPGTRDVAVGWLLAAIPAGLIMLQPDLGSAVVLGALAFVVIAVAGAPRRWVLGMAVAAVGLVVAALTTPLLSDYQRDRLLAFANPSADPQGIGYQTRQVRLAIGSGGWWGQGFMEGRQTQAGFIPYQLNDFIFSVAGEELGFVGAAGLLLLLSFIVVRIFVVAGRSRDAFGRFVGGGVGTWLAFQVFQNVGMNLGVVPVTGLPLPFVSYGGSSMFASWLAIGIVNAAYAAGHRDRV